MSVSAVCSNGHKLVAPDKLAGKTIRCPSCGVVTSLPAAIIRAELVSDAQESADIANPLADYATPLAESQPDEAQSNEYVEIVSFDFDDALPAAHQFAVAAEAQPTSNIPQSRSALKNAGGGGTPLGNGLSSPKSLMPQLLLLGGGGFSGGVVVGLLILGLISLFSTSGGAADAAREYADSPSLLRELRSFRPNGPKSNPMDEEHFQATLASNRKVFPNFMKTTRAEERRLAAGKSDPAVAGKLQLLRAAMPGNVNIEGSDDFKLHMFAARSRMLLLLRSTADDQWESVQQIEEKVFGEQSLIKVYGAPEFEPQRVGIRLQPQLDKVAGAVTGLGRASNGRAPRYFGMLEGREDGLSWRVAILPFMGQQALYKQFHLDEPWDSPHNLTLLEEMPAEFQTSQQLKPGFTTIQAVAGPGAPAADWSKPGENGFAIKFIMGGKELASEWTRPGGLELDTSQGAEQFKTCPCELGYPVALLNRDIRWLSKTAPAAKVAEYVDRQRTPAKREVIDAELPELFPTYLQDGYLERYGLSLFDLESENSPVSSDDLIKWKFLAAIALGKIKTADQAPGPASREATAQP